VKILRQDQDQAITQLRHSLARGSKRPMLQCPTGFGKTVIASAVTQMALNKGKRVIFCVPALSLIDQTVASFYDDEIKTIGVLQGNHELTNYTQPVQIASVQTLQRRSIPPADLVIIDEAHRWFKFYGEWMSDWNRIPFVGLSATPWTKGLGKYYDDLIICATTGKLISEGKLSGFKVYGPSAPDLSKCRTVAGDYHEGDLADVMDTPAITADVVSSWFKLGKGRPTLCFAVDRAHAQHLAERFNAAGVKTGYIDAFTEMPEREIIRQKFHTGEIEVVCNVGCLTTGVDWDVRCISLARPTKSEILFTQIIGRGLRTADGKDHCVIIDHTSTHQNLGFVTDIHHDSLDDGKPKESKNKNDKPEKLPKACASCSFLKPAGVHACPNCGFAPSKQTQIREAEGILEELKPKGKVKKADKQEFYSGLLSMAESTGKSKGWVSHTYRDYFGVWPVDLRHQYGAITTDVRMFVKHKNIAYAKRQSA